MGDSCCRCVVGGPTTGTTLSVVGVVPVVGIVCVVCVVRLLHTFIIDLTFNNFFSYQLG